jgi:hypothetical protein
MFNTICQWLSYRSSAQVIAFLVSFLASSIKFGLIVFAAGYVITLMVSSYTLLDTPLTGICHAMKAKADPRRYVVCFLSGQIGGRTSLAGIQEASCRMVTRQTVESGLINIIGSDANSRSSRLIYHISAASAR